MAGIDLSSSPEAPDGFSVAGNDGLGGNGYAARVADIDRAGPGLKFRQFSPTLRTSTSADLPFVMLPVGSPPDAEQTRGLSDTAWIDMKR